MAALRSSLESSLGALIKSTDTKRARELKKHTGNSPLPALDAVALHKSISALWSKSGGNESVTAEPSSSKSKDVLRSVLDMVGRDTALRPVITGDLAEPLEDASDAVKAHFQTQLQDRLDMVLTLYEVAYASVPDAPALEPGAVFIPLLEEFTELLSVATWHELFGYVETRAPRFTKNMPASRGKALPLLRTINAFQRFLSHTPQDLKLRGRVQLFASSAIGIADKSAINMRGEYAVITTTWEEQVDEGDVQMEDADGTKPLDFYSTLWSLQKYFAHPPSLDGPAIGEPAQTPFDQFRAKSDFVLSRLYEQTKREKVLLGKNPDRATRKRTRESEDLSYPRYLTAKNLLDYELADQQFRRQVLVQYFILFQFLLNLTPASANKQQFTGGMPKTFIIDGDKQTWITQTIQAVRDELRNMSPDGPRFEETLVQLMQRERRYAQWKNEGCPESEWEVAPLDPDMGPNTAEKWKRQCRPMRRWPYKLGTAGLTRVWENGYKGMNDFTKTTGTAKTVFELEEELSRIEMDEEDDKAMGREPPAEYAEQKKTIRWSAIREARRTHPRVVAQMKDYDLHKLVEAIREVDEKEARYRDRAHGDAAAEEAETEAEARAEHEAEQEAAKADAEEEETGEAEGVNGDATAHPSPETNGDATVDGEDVNMEDGIAAVSEQPTPAAEATPAEGDVEAPADGEAAPEGEDAAVTEAPSAVETPVELPTENTVGTEPHSPEEDLGEAE